MVEVGVFFNVLLVMLLVLMGILMKRVRKPIGVVMVMLREVIVRVRLTQHVEKEIG